MKATPGQLRALLHVLRHGGYAEAERATDISKAALHAGVKGAEQAYQCQFFEPRPFRLTRPGRLIVDALEQFVRQMDVVEDQIERAKRPQMRIAAAELATTQYLPGVIAAFERRHPDIHCETESGPEERMRARLRAGELECALAPESTAWRGFTRADVAELRLALLVPPSSPIASLEQLWLRSPVPFRLAVPQSAPALSENFAQGLKGLGVTWQQWRRVSSVQAVEKSVERSGDFGLVVQHPALRASAAPRMLRLDKFPAVRVSLFWIGRKTPALATLLALLRAAAEGSAESGEQ